MGIIILPLLLISLIVGIIAFVKSIKAIILKSIGLKELLLGLLTSSLIFGLICFVYLIEGKAWGLSPAFRIPIFMIFIPFGIHLTTEKNEKERIRYLSKIFLTSIVFTLILGIIFNNILFNLIDYLGIKKHY